MNFHASPLLSLFIVCLCLSVFILHNRSCSLVPWSGAFQGQLVLLHQDTHLGIWMIHLVSSTFSVEHDLMGHQSCQSSESLSWCSLDTKTPDETCHYAKASLQALYFAEKTWRKIKSLFIYILQFGLKQSRGAEHCGAYKSLLNAHHIELLGHTGSLAALRINFLSQSSSLPIDLLEACPSKEGTWCQHVPNKSQHTNALIRSYALCTYFHKRYPDTKKIYWQH